ncbi:MAG: transcription termination factor Rho [Thermoleophilaceae bacterium]|jgi:transcription termination factor Rho|nr:transcription termination factor Rho [Thermoleophilaceae bacterium]
MTVLQRKELESSPLADLHAIASELGLEGFRSKRKGDLIGAILDAQGGEEPEEPADQGSPAEEEEPAAPAEEAEPDEVPSDEVLEGPSGDEAPAEEVPGERELDVVEEEPEVADEVSDEEILTGGLDILTNGSGFLRLDPTGQSRDDVYVSPAQIRRCELRSGDEVSGPVRPPRRNERHPSLVRVESVNGADAEPPEQRPWFGELTPVFPKERLGELGGVPYGKGSRVGIVGPPGAGATNLLRQAVKELAESYPDVGVQIALAGVRPEEVGEWRELGPPVVGGSFERSAEAQAQAAELAIERAKRQVERGGHAAVVVDGLHSLPPATRRRIFGAGRATEEGGTLTILADAGEDREVLRWATSWIVLGSDVESGSLHGEDLK